MDVCSCHRWSRRGWEEQCGQGCGQGAGVRVRGHRCHLPHHRPVCAASGGGPQDAAGVEALLPQIEIGMEYTDQGQKMILNGEDVTGLIRTPEVSMATSTCSAIPAVRAFLLQLQRDLAEKNNVLMDGRDIGTVVLPHAQLKVFLTASPQERARRRVLQLEESGRKADYEAILRDIQQRDYQDSHRETAPLRPAEDSVLVDTSGVTFEESVRRLVELVRERL